MITHPLDKSNKNLILEANCYITNDPFLKEGDELAVQDKENHSQEIYSIKKAIEGDTKIFKKGTYILILQKVVNTPNIGS